MLASIPRLAEGRRKGGVTGVLSQGEEIVSSEFFFFLSVEVQWTGHVGVQLRR